MSKRFAILNAVFIRWLSIDAFLLFPLICLQKFIESQAIPIDRISIEPSLCQSHRHWIDQALQPVTQNEWHDDVVAQLFACYARPAQLIYLMISNLIYQTGFMAKGRIDIFAIIYSNELRVRRDIVASCRCLDAMTCYGILL